MRSLRRRLIVTLWLALGLVGLASTGYAYWQSLSDTDELLDYQMEQVARLLARQSFAPPAPGAMPPAIRTDEDAEDGFEVTVRNAAGQVQYATTPRRPLPAQTRPGFSTVRIDARSYRVYSAASDGRPIVVAQRTEVRREIAASAALASLVPVGLMLPVLALVIGLVIRSQLRVLRAAADEVARRPPLALEPLPVHGLPSEVLPLVVEINRLLERLRATVEREQRFVADAAHALRTPLAALQLQADVLGGAADDAENAERVADLRAGIRRAALLSDQLLALARSEPAAGPVRGRVALDTAAAEVHALYAPTAALRAVDFRLDARSETTVPGDPRLLSLLVGALVDNALRYTPPGRTVILRTRKEAGAAQIEVSDEGPGLAEAELEAVFERFYRAPGDVTEGSGLGLAVVRNIAARLGGRAWLEKRRDRSGLVACVRLPDGAQAGGGVD